MHPKYEVVIGLEVHVQLATKSKVFSGSSTAFGAEPNTSTDPVCLGMPGTLPVLNRGAVEAAVRLGLAAGCTIRTRCRFSRKHYFYPDLPKGYQISQFDEPICEGGAIKLRLHGEAHSVRLTRIHMEEDAGKNLHAAAGVSFVDYNRAGVPLCEIVSEPDVRSAEEAAEYVRAVRALVRYLGIGDGNMEEGSLRCDANVSLRLHGAKEYGTKAEIKNMNSFKNVRDAVEYEVKRQATLLDRGERVAQETRLWDASRGVTQAMRSKEQAHDYRYFPEPDLPPLVVDEKFLAEVRASQPELPEDRFARYTAAEGLSPQDAGKNLHAAAGVSFDDYNRAGVPLCEIVSEPDVRSAEEAAEYVRAVRALVRYLGIGDGNMEEGSLRCDANVSLRLYGAKEYGTKAEIKNMNSFKNVRDAVEFEVKRQAALLDRGERVAQETRL
ncbi:MAG TPA: Asp-tRNA(Asn)/Glu-tRNA(Gln) amidotransferase subunit GatB, partial [Polyangia bacterium]|nr:Asp-tRNA(Asn)/Glu-tRNA(Gln) amidotransferase subunit GatB [Polyangia bacterium]